MSRTSGNMRCRRSTRCVERLRTSCGTPMNRRTMSRLLNAMIVSNAMSDVDTTPLCQAPMRCSTKYRSQALAH